MRPRASLRLLLHALLGLLAATAAAARPLLPLFRQPRAGELSDIASTGAALAWSAHQAEDALLVVSNSGPLALACLLDDIDPGDQLQLELSWIIENEATGAQLRHTLTASGGPDVNGGSKQTFTLDMGPGMQAASGVFHRLSGSVLTLAFPVPPLGPGPLSVACHLRLAGALEVPSARLRLWDERPSELALLATQADGLVCRRARHRLPASLAAVTLDCEWPAVASLRPQALLPIETAVFGLYVNGVDRRCADDAAGPRLQSNSSDPNVFFAMVTPQRGRLRQSLRFGWTNEGDGAALQSRLDADGGGGGVDLCVSADAALPSGLRRLRLRWRARIVADVGERNRTSVVGLGGDAFAFGFDNDNNGNAVADISIDPISDPPLPRSLPCPYLCPSSAAASPLCKFAWLHSTAAHPNASDFAAASRLTDPSLGILSAPHGLLLMPWQLPGNPTPPPQAGTWTCRSQASVSSGVKVDDSSALSPVIRVQVSARTSFCANRMPRQSVVFLGNAWTTQQSLAINCTVCGYDETVDAQLAVLGSVGADGISAEPTSRQQLPGGVLALGLQFTKFGDDARAGSVLVRCRAVDQRGRGAVAFSAVEVVAAPANAVLDADCDGDTGGSCRRFRCPMDPALAASLRLLPVSVGFLFSLQLRGTAPPQQVLVSSDRLLADSRLSRLRCTQLIYYSDGVGEDPTLGNRRQQVLVPDPAAAAVYRSALGVSRFSRLLLAIESGWLEASAPPFDQPPIQSDEAKPSPKKEKTTTKSDYKPDAYSPTEKSDTMDIIIGVVLAICVLVAIVFAVMFFIRGRRLKAAAAAAAATESAGTASGAATTTTEAPAEEPETKKRPKRKKKKPDEEKLESGTDKGSEDDKKKKKTKKKKHKPEDKAAASDAEEKPAKKADKKKKEKGADKPKASHNVADSALCVLSKPLKLLPAPQLAVQMSMSSSVPTSSKAIAVATCFGKSPSNGATDQGPEVVRIHSPAVRSWRMSDVTTLADNVSAKAAVTSTTTTAVTTLSGCHNAQTVLQDVTSVCSRHANRAQIEVSGAPSSVAAIQSSGSPHHALRIDLSPELHVEFLALPDDLPDVAASDEQCRLPPERSPPQLRDRISHATTKLPEAARVSRCLICQPPRFRLATTKVGVEMSASSSSSPSTLTPPPESPGARDNEFAPAEVDVPLSEPSLLPPSVAGASIAGADDAMSEVGQMPQPQVVEDFGSTRSGGWSESPFDDAGAMIAESDEDCKIHILDAVQGAIERSMTCD